MKRISAFIGISFVIASCGGNESILRSGKETPTPAAANATPSLAPMEKELAAMRNADFEWVYLFRRADSQKIDAADREFIKGLTADANRRVVTEDDMYVVIGMNSRLPQETVDKLLTRFAVGTYPKRPPRNANSSSNANK